MHSSGLRGSDFELTVQGNLISHPSWFESYAVNDRLGLVIDRPMDGLGAAALLLAHTTAFYDCRRSTTDEFFSYPDFFTFQRSTPLVSYGMFDIWPGHKNVHLPDSRWDALAAVASRGINILVVPHRIDSSHPLQPESSTERAIFDSLERNITICYAYSPNGQTEQPDLIVQCGNGDVQEWGEKILAGASPPDGAAAMWHDAFVRGPLTQSYRQIDTETALASTAP